MCSLLSALPAPRTAFRLSKLHSNNSKLARAVRGNRFYPLSRPCSVHFACHYAPPVRLAREAITTLSNSLHCEVIYSERVPCRQKKKNTLDLCHSQVPSACLQPPNTVRCRYGQRWLTVHAILFHSSRAKRGAFVAATADPNEHGCAPPFFPRAFSKLAASVPSVWRASPPLRTDRN